MMLLQKPQAVSLSSPALYTHRRHPSAPVVVQPTRTPGLLTLSKPIRPSPQRQATPQYRREHRSAVKPAKHASAVVRAQPLTPAAEIKPPTIQAVPATPSPQSRGRSQAKQSKEKTQIYRSASHSSLRGKHGRQPSPPTINTTQQTQQLQQAPSQAEANVVPPIKSSNLFDPFLDHSNSPPPSPSLGSKPSGKLARRRQQMAIHPPTVPLSRAIPVPKLLRTKTSIISRSEPSLSHMMQPSQAATHPSTYQDFPICDDSTEVIDHEYASFPSTPRRSTHARSGPNTSPLPTRNNGVFDFNFPPSTPSAPTGKRAIRKHRRVPSEGVFNMSSDEDLSTGPGGVVLNANVQALFGLTLGKRTSLPASPFSTPVPARDAMVAPMGSRESSPSSDSSSESYEAKKKAGYFASSMFQNSPSPEELPDPLNL